MKFNKVISRRFIRKIVAQFRLTRSVSKENIPKSKPEDLTRRVLQLVDEDGEVSLRAIAARVNSNKDAVRAILIQHKYKSFKPIEVQN